MCKIEEKTVQNCKIEITEVKTKQQILVTKELVENWKSYFRVNIYFQKNALLGKKNALC